LLTLSKIKTLAANVAVGQAQKKKENPYLSHRSGGGSAPKPPEGVTETTGPLAAAIAAAAPLVAHDDRIRTSSRDLKAKKSFNFIEAGECPRATEADLL
jgi:hypothetical protein